MCDDTCFYMLTVQEDNSLVRSFSIRNKGAANLVEIVKEQAECGEEFFLRQFRSQHLCDFMERERQCSSHLPLYISR